MSDETLDEILRSMRRHDPDARYYALTVGADENGQLTWSAQSHWVGPSPTKKRWEMRAASIVDADKMAHLWQAVGERHVVVQNTEQLAVWLTLGGHALVDEAIAQEHLPDFIAPKEVALTGPFRFVSLSEVPPEAFARAPTKKQRMRVLKRDDFRCRVCGRRSSDHVDIELHVHHIRPHGLGGLTEHDNLITLCSTCHTGLDPHEEHRLFFLGQVDLDTHLLPRGSYRQDVERYRQLVSEMLNRDQPPR